MAALAWPDEAFALQLVCGKGLAASLGDQEAVALMSALKVTTL
jgi:hypothetical protein